MIQRIHDARSHFAIAFVEEGLPARQDLVRRGVVDVVAAAGGRAAATAAAGGGGGLIPERLGHGLFEGLQRVDGLWHATYCRRLEQGLAQAAGYAQLLLLGRR